MSHFFDMLTTIALLCTTSAGGEKSNSLDSMHHRVAKVQLECHKYYVKCLKEKDGLSSDISRLESLMVSCILKRDL